MLRSSSMLNSFSNCFITTFDTLGEIAGSVNKTVGIATKEIDNRSQEHAHNSKSKAIMRTAQVHNTIQEELDSDEKLKAKYAEIEKLWK